MTRTCLRRQRQQTVLLLLQLRVLLPAGTSQARTLQGRSPLSVLPTQWLQLPQQASNRGMQHYPRHFPSLKTMPPITNLLRPRPMRTYTRKRIRLAAQRSYHAMKTCLQTLHRRKMLLDFSLWERRQLDDELIVAADL